MSILRVCMIAATLLAVVASPVLFRSAASSTAAPSAYAAGSSGVDPAGRVYADGNNNDNNGNGNSNSNGNGNSNSNGNGNSNSNGNGNDNSCDSNSNGNDNSSDSNDNSSDSNSNSNSNDNNCDNNSNGNGNSNGNSNDNFVSGPPSSPPPPPPVSSVSESKCFSAGETGSIQLTLDGGTVTIRTAPTGMPSSTNVTLRRVDPATVPPPPSGTMLDTLVWSIDALSGCSGAALGQLPGDVNEGIAYTVPADKSKLQIARLVNGAWVDVPTTPDPSPTNPYISATIHDLGTYVVYQKP
jgi:hypothetical protein